MNLHLARTIKAIQYRFRNDVIVYAIRCQVNNMVYVGSTFIPARRVHQHLVTGEKSNDALQQDIKKYGIDKFTLHVMEILDVDGMSHSHKSLYKRQREQYHMDKFPQAQLYNSMRSTKET